MVKPGPIQIADGFDILTYRKGNARKRLRWEYREDRAVLDSCEVVYQPADHGIRLLGGKLELRCRTGRSRPWDHDDVDG